jgi:hypothetical protein
VKTITSYFLSCVFKINVRLLCALCFVTSPLFAQVPENAHATSSTGSWTCNHGFKRVGNECRKIEIPTNARLNHSGSDWVCDYGFERYGGKCAKVIVPENARLSHSGSWWLCNPGFRKTGNTCEQIPIPENGRLNTSGTDWVCNSGFKKSAGRCDKVQVPQNAELTYAGNSWRCKRNFIKRDLQCITVGEATDDEIRREVIAQSIASYPGNCPCPYFSDSAGRSCGGRSAYSRPGGHSPLCYPNDVSQQAVSNFRRTNSN